MIDRTNSTVRSLEILTIIVFLQEMFGQNDVFLPKEQQNYFVWLRSYAVIVAQANFRFKVRFSLGLRVIT